MITSRRTFGLVYLASFLVASTYFQAPPARGGEQQERYADERIAIDHARPVRSGPTRTATKRQSTVAKAATGRILNDPPVAPLDGSLVKGKVRQVGFLESHGAGCGPVCDCASCGAEPVCGIEEVYHGDPGCGLEPGCGFEVGCGIGAAMERVSGCGGCGIDGCDGCCESTCGVEEMYFDGPGCGMEAVGDCSCDACSGCGVEGVPICLPLLRVNWCQYDFFAGVQGFTGPLNFVNTSAANSNTRSGTGSFGFYEGFNHGRSLRRWFCCDMAAQFGLRATQSNLSGAGFTDETRHQIFLTGGLFRRVDYGLQYGVVLDYLNDDWYFQGDSLQLRGELSWRCRSCHVTGFQFMAGVNDDTSTTFVRNAAGNLTTSVIAFEPTDQYRFFYRRLLNQSGYWSAFGGWTDRDDGILGADLNLPLRRCLALSTGATYLIPNQGNKSGGNEQEVWNISLGLVYRPGGPRGAGRYSRPMFDVADNGTFMIDRK